MFRRNFDATFPNYWLKNKELWAEYSLTMLCQSNKPSFSFVISLLLHYSWCLLKIAWFSVIIILRCIGRPFFCRTSVFYLSKLISAPLCWGVGLYSVSLSWRWDGKEQPSWVSSYWPAVMSAWQWMFCLVFSSCCWWCLLRCAMLSSPDDLCCTGRIGRERIQQHPCLWL